MQRYLDYTRETAEDYSSYQLSSLFVYDTFDSLVNGFVRIGEIHNTDYTTLEVFSELLLDYDDYTCKIDTLLEKAKTLISLLEKPHLAEITRADVVYRTGDLLEANEPVIAHCISADAKMSKGIALKIKEKYPARRNIFQNATVRDVIIQKAQDESSYTFSRIIYHLVTKECYFHKPTQNDFRFAMKKLLDACIAKGISHLAVPRLGSGLDKLPWSFVEEQLLLFVDSGIKVIVYELPSVDIIKTENNKDENDDALSETSTNSTISNSLTQTNLTSQQIEHCADAAMEQIQHWIDATGITKRKLIKYLESFEEFGTKCPYYSAKKAGVKNPEGIHVYNIKQDKILTITKEIRRQDFIINYSHVFYQEKRGNLKTFHIIRTPIRYETDPETKRKIPFLDTEVFENVSKIYVCNETKIFNDFEFSNLYQGATKASILKDLITLQPNISLTEGVPGCGKTTYILKSHDYKKDMILTTTREGTNDIRNRALEILRERGVVTEQQLPNGHSLSVINQDDGVSIPWSVFSEKRYKTLDSMLMRKPTCNVEKLLIDEALMQHPGRVVLAVIAAKAKLVELLGDRGQIGYINRARQSICKFSDYSFIPVEKVLYVSYRCPLDVAVIFSKCYARNIQLIPKHDKPFMSTKELLNTMELKQISHESEIPNVNGNVKYLTFTQPDKMMLTAHLKKVHKDYTNGVNTVHEYQGSQSDTVVLVRLNEIASTSLFLDIRYVLVALTRHKSKLIYCMKRTVNTDLVMQKIEESKKITKISAKNFLKLTKAGAYDPVVQEASVDVNMSYISQPRAVDPATLELLPSIIIDAETNFFQPMAYETTDKHLRFKRIFDISTSDSHSFNMIREPSRIVLQDFVDTLLPGTSVEDQTFDAHMVHFSDLEVNVENVIIDADKIVPAIRRRNERNILTNVDSFLKPTDGLDPVLRTPMPLNRGQTHYETMLGMIKRNMNVPQMAGIVDDDYLVQQMVKRYILSYVSVDGLANISYFMRENVNVNTEALRNWVVKNGISPKLIGINNDKYNNVGYREKNMSTFNYMLKSQVKPKLNVDCTREYASVQTIAYHDKSITSIYSPVFRDMSFRKKKILKKNAIIFNEMSNDDFQEILNTSFPNPQVLNNRTSLQCDISKYDKSQGIVALRFNYYIYLALGMPKDMADTWYLTHLDTELRAKDVGLSANVKYQRKSGDSDTFGGNTDFTMGVMSYIFKMYSTTHEKEIDKLLEHNTSENWLSEFLYSLSSLNDHHPYLIKTTYDIATFAGDDSWIIGDMLYSEDMSSAASLLFNLETKFCLYKCHYFCSRILVPLTDHWVVVPDLLKLLVKLGRKDIKNSAHLEEYRISLCDLVKGYLDPTICEYISMYIKEIYKINTCSVNVINNLISFIYNPASFSKLWKATHEEKFFEINPAGALIIFEDSSEVSRATLAKNVEKFSPEYLSKKPLVILTNNLHTFDKYVTITNFNMCLEPTKASLDKFIKYKIPTVYFSPDIDFLKHLNKMDDVRVLQHYSNVPINFKFKHQENFNNIPFETVLNKSKYIKHSRLAIGQAISLSSYKKIMSSKKSLMSLSYYTSVFFVGKNPDSCDIYQTEFANETHIVRLVRTRASNLKYISSARKDLTDE
nr:MAG: replicase [Ips virga-like virus 1]